tara:strand:- start:3405 stop:3794 length:390 start_codon:yes stop_codon:yes gene_type:complete
MIIFIFFVKQSTKTNNLLIDNAINLTYDIIDPKFTINNNKEKISIRANEGNFIDENNVLLKNNVTFKSKKFKIESSEVFFDKLHETAFSNKNSKFFSNNTIIDSKGFEIKNKGDTIQFNGKTKIILNKK